MPEYKYEREKTFDDKDVINLLKKASSRRDRCLVSLLYLTGARISEILELKGKDIQIEEDEIRISIRPKKTGDYGPVSKSQDLILDKKGKFVACIIEHSKTKKAEESIINMTRQRAWQIIRELSGVSPHFFRYSRVVQLLDKGYSLDQVRKWIGRKTQPVEYSSATESEIKEIGKGVV